MKSRSKQFKRSFVGCWTCRRRKIKCDSERPECQRCVKSKLKCEGYDVKLNWSLPLTLSSFKDNGDEEEEDLKVEFPGSSTPLKRSKIDLCKWPKLYSYYHEMDNDLQSLEIDGINRAGPFGVIDDMKVKNDVRKSTTGTSTSTRAPLIQLNPSQNSHRQKQYPNDQVKSFEKSGFETTNKLIDRQRLLLNIDFVKQFLDSHILTIFRVNQSDEIYSSLSSLIKVILGEMILYDNNPLFSSLISSLIMVSKIKSLNTTQSEELHRLANENKTLSYQISNIHFIDEPQFLRPFILLLMMKILINSIFGTYEPNLFRLSLHKSQDKLLNILSEHYKFLQCTNNLLNHSQYKFPTEFGKIYEDVLDTKYNLLKNFKGITRKHHSSSMGYGKIEISIGKTTKEEIIKIPKFSREDDIGDDELPPPTFTINFTNDENEDEDEDDDDFEESEKNDRDNKDFENVALVNGVFAYDEKCIGEDVKILGISRVLIHLYCLICELINHKRYFTERNNVSRNFPLVCSEFEELLTTSIFLKYELKERQKSLNEDIVGASEDVIYHFNDDQSLWINPEDESFYHFLVFLFFKYVKNYPTKILRYHLNHFQKSPTLGIMKFVSNLDNHLRKNESSNLTVWDRNHMSESVIDALNDPEYDVDNGKMFNDWYSLIDDPFFVL